MRRDQAAIEGRVHRLKLDSQALKGNILGDPTERIIDVYVTAGHDGKGLPLLVDLVGFTAGGPAHTNWKNFGENAPERLDRLIGTGAMAPCVVETSINLDALQFGQSAHPRPEPLSRTAAPVTTITDRATSTATGM